MRVSSALGASVAGSKGGLLWIVDFTTLALGVVTLPESLLLTRASDGFSVQTGASTVLLLSAGNDTARVGRSGGAATQGLVLDRLAVNDFLVARGPGSGGIATLTANDANGPDGTLNADRFEADANEYSNYQTPALAATPYTFTSWAARRSGAGAGQWQSNFFCTNHVSAFGPLTEAWQRNQITVTNGGASTAIIPVDARDLTATGGRTATPLDYLVDMTQVEAGLYATEWIPTAGTPVTRAGEQLSLADRGPLLSASGRLSLEVKFIAKGGSHQYAANLRVWTCDASNYCEINATTRLLKVVIDSVTYTFPVAVNWNRMDTVELFVEAGGGLLPTRGYLRVTPFGITPSGPAVLLGQSVGAQSAISAVGAIDLLCNGSSNQLTSWVQQIKAYS